MAKIKKSNPGTPDVPKNAHSVPADPNANWRPKTDLDVQADTRDILSAFVGGGHTSVAGSEDLQNNYKRLTQLVGAPLAQKLHNQAALFNQRPDAKNLSPEQRVQSFFTLGSNDGELASFMKSAGGIGQGQTVGFNNSPLISNSILQNKAFAAEPATPTPTRRIKLVAKK